MRIPSELIRTTHWQLDRTDATPKQILYEILSEGRLACFETPSVAAPHVRIPGTTCIGTFLVHLSVPALQFATALRPTYMVTGSVLGE